MTLDEAAKHPSSGDPAPIAGAARSPHGKRLLMRQRRMPLVLAGFITLLLLPVLVFAFIIAGNYVIDFAMNSLGMRSLFKRPIAVVDAGALLGSTAALLVAGCVFRRLRWRIFPYDGSICGECGYDLRGSSTGACPECGCAASPRP